MGNFFLKDCNPYIRYVNNYRPTYSYVEKERILYDYEWMYVMEGEVEMYYGAAHYTLKKGDLFFLKPFIKNHIEVKEHNGFRTHCIHFDWSIPAPEENFTAEEYYMHTLRSSDHDQRLAQLLIRQNPQPEDFDPPAHITGIPYEKLSGLFARCYDAFLDNSPAGKLKVRSLFLEILALLTSQYTPREKQAPIHPRILRALRYLREHYKEDISVPFLAGYCGLSPKYFGTLFRSGTGKSVNQYILDLRLFDAREMLLGTDLGIEEIAESLGFGNAFYFSRCFKQQEKISPLNYRKDYGSFHSKT